MDARMVFQEGPPQLRHLRVKLLLPGHLQSHEHQPPQQQEEQVRGHEAGEGRSPPAPRAAMTPRHRWLKRVQRNTTRHSTCGFKYLQRDMDTGGRYDMEDLLCVWMKLREDEKDEGGNLSVEFNHNNWFMCYLQNVCINLAAYPVFIISLSQIQHVMDKINSLI